MTNFVIHTADDKTKTFDSEEKFREVCDLLDERDADYTTEEGSKSVETGSVDTQDSEGDPEGESTPNETEVVQTGAENVQSLGEDNQSNGVDDIAELVENPIDWLGEKNDEYVNIVKGKDAISKRGFRYIQSKFEITTESKVVKFIEEPLGVIVWAKAELPDGRSAEAHGEGYQFEADMRGSTVSKNEFIRYGDTRAKSRALADLTSSGALATEELQGEINE